MEHWAIIAVFMFLVLLTSAVKQQPPDVVKGENTVQDFWLQKEKPGRLTTYKYNNCGDPNKEVANVTSLIIGPDPLTFPGPLDVQFSGSSRVVVQSPIAVSLLLEVQVGSTWVKIPCVDTIGSCYYEDICDLLAQITECPEAFVQAGIPCMCPFPQGAYNLPQTEFDVTVPVFPAGNYHGVANITSSGRIFVTCVELFATFA